jgi:hypothetical protein
VFEGGLVKEAMDRTLDVDELLVQRAGASRAADASSIGAVVRDLLILEELGYVEDDDFAGRLGQGESTARPGRAGDDSCL